MMSHLLPSSITSQYAAVTAAVFGGLGILWFYKYLRGKRNLETLQGRVVLITGASAGIGEACAHAFYRCGAKVILCARRTSELSRVKTNMRRHTVKLQTYEPEILQMDLEDLDSLDQKAEEAWNIHGRIDVLVNNGGLGSRGGVLDTVMDVYQKVMQVNYFGTIALTKAILPRMISNKSGQIVFVSSIQGKLAIPFRSAYAASKHAIQSFSDSLRAEVAADNIHVCVVSPSYVRTTFSINALDSDSSTHGVMDSTTAKGMSSEYLAKRIVNAVVFKEHDVSIGPLTHTLAPLVRQLFPALIRFYMRQTAKLGMKAED